MERAWSRCSCMARAASPGWCAAIEAAIRWWSGKTTCVKLRYCQTFFAHAAHQITDRIQQQHQERIVGHLGDQAVVFGVQRVEPHPIVLLKLHLAQQGLDARNILGSRLFSGLAGVFHLQYFAHLMQVIECDLPVAGLNQDTERFQDVVAVQLAHDRTHAWARFEQPFRDEHAHRLSQGRAADAQLVAQLALGWQHRAWRQRPLGDLFLDGIDHPIDQAVLRAYRGKHGPISLHQIR